MRTQKMHYCCNASRPLFLLLKYSKYKQMNVKRYFSGLQRYISSRTMNEQSRVVAIEGNTGCGKTEVLHWLSTFPDVITCEEPVETWRHFSGQNLFNLRYTNPKRWSFAFQNLVQLTRLKMYGDKENNNPNTIRFIERSLHSNRYCFLEMAKEMKYFQDIEFAILAEWFKYLENELRTRLELIETIDTVYLRTFPAVALDRVKSRNRFEEQKITIDQLQNIHSKYESWISNGASGFKFVIIDANNDAKTVQEDIMSHLKQQHILK